MYCSFFASNAILEFKLYCIWCKELCAPYTRRHVSPYLRPGWCTFRVCMMWTYRIGTNNSEWKIESCRVWVNASQTTSHSFESNLSNNVCTCPTRHNNKASSVSTLKKSKVAASSTWTEGGDPSLGKLTETGGTYSYKTMVYPMLITSAVIRLPSKRP